jgi:lipoprotein-anchoring transpeptidase ErfK/SrfK
MRLAFLAGDSGGEGKMAVAKHRWRYGALLALILIIPAALWASFMRSDEPMRLEVDLGARTLKVIENGDVVNTYGIAIGRPSHPTPTGTFRTGQIIWNPAWNPPPTGWARDAEPQAPGSPSNPMQAVKIYFNPPYYFIHGTNDPDSIGEAASHGCIRMTPGDASNLAHQIEEAGGHVTLSIHG